jgi:CHAD domain-containing protein
MAFEFERRRSVDANVRALATECLDDAITMLSSPSDLGLTASVHEARKRAKKVRSLARLVAPALGREQRKVNRLVRDGSRELSDLRDAHALLASWVRLGGVLDLDSLAPVGSELQRRADAATATDDDPRLANAADRFDRARKLVSTWDLPDGLGAVRLGLQTTQRRARNAYGTARREPTDETLHELRKRIKDLWYHTRLVRPAAPSLLDGHVATLDGLSDALGDDHDLAVLLATASAEPDDFGGREVVGRLHEVLVPVRSDLQTRGLDVAGRVVAEAPKAFARRVTTYLELWYELGDEPRVGALDEVLSG